MTANETAFVRTFDALGRATTLVETLVGGGVANTIVDAFDAVGDKTTQAVNGVTATYSYDAARKLTGQTKSGQCATFVYDPVGNMLVKSQDPTTAISMTYDLAGRLTTSIQGAVVTTYTFDANGNQTADDVNGVMTSYVYDKENRLTQVAYSDGSISTYTYCGDGLRRAKQEPGEAVRTMIWDSSDYLGEM